MNKYLKLGLVLAGYVAALGVALVATYFWDLPNQSQPGGMYAEGESIFFVEAWGFLSLFPTALALYFLRPVTRFWAWLSWVSLALAATAPIAELVNSLIRVFKLYAGVWPFVGMFGLGRVGLMPLLALAFGVCALFSPDKRSRRFLWVGSGVEALTFAYVLLNFLLWNRFA